MRKLEEICGITFSKIIKEKDPSVDTLHLPGGRPFFSINEEDMYVIIEELKNNPFITKLILSETDIPNQALKGIEALQHITYLDLSNNDLDDESLIHITKMNQLSFLNLGGLNNFTAKALDSIFQHLTNLETLFLDGIEISLIDKRKIPNKLSLNVNGKEIYYEGNYFNLIYLMINLEKNEQILVQDESD